MLTLGSSHSTKSLASRVATVGESAQIRVRVDQCVSAVGAVEVPVFLPIIS